MEKLIAYIENAGFLLKGPVDLIGTSTKRFFIKKHNGWDVSRFVDIDPEYWNEHDPEYFIPIFNRAMDDIKRMERDLTESNRIVPS